MATRYSGQIVIDGLLLSLDAASPRSYPGSGTIWYDGSGQGYDSTLSTATIGTVSSSIDMMALDGIDDIITVAGTTPTALQGSPEFSVSGWFRRSSSVNFTNGACWGIGGNALNGGINSYSWNSINNEIATDLWGRVTLGTGQTYSDTTWKHICWIYRSGAFNTTNVSIWIDGVEYTGGSLIVRRDNASNTPSVNTNGVVLGRAGLSLSNYYAPVGIGSIQFYTRELSAADILQNYNATKERFD